jgi:L-lactate dehydrogenase (cytochrome)
MKAASIGDYRELARRRLPRFLFEYIDGGAYDEVTLRRNVGDLQGVALRQRVLRDVSDIDLSTELFGQRQELPVALGPIGLAGMTARRGEVQAARAAEAAGVPFCLSTVSACSLREVRAGVGKPFWFQLYMIRDRAFMADMLAQAAEAGITTLVFTVDMPVPGTRYRDYRSGLAGASGLAGDARRVFQAMLRPAWAWDVGVNGRPHSLGNVAPVLGENSGLEDFFAWMRTNFDPRVTWADLDWVRERWKGPIVLKGVLDPADARQAAGLGLDGLIVSNHGGRQLDGVLSTAQALPPIADAVGDRIAVLADGGVRSGLDVVRLLALGARGVLLGRAWAYALAGGGGAGVAHVLQLIRAEMTVAMALTGATRLADLSPEVLARGPPILRAAE